MKVVEKNVPSLIKRFATKATLIIKIIKGNKFAVVIQNKKTELQLYNFDMCELTLLINASHAEYHNLQDFKEALENNWQSISNQMQSEFKQGTKAIEEMSIEELKIDLKKSIKAEKYERAAIIEKLIKQKQK